MIFLAVEELLKKQLGVTSVELSVPKNSEYGDVAFPCFSLAKEQKKSPVAIAEEFAKKLKPSGLVKEITAIAGFVNFKIDRQALAKQLLPKIDETFGSSKDGKKKRVVVEFSSPNIAKPFSIGHLRSTVIGRSLANLYVSQGWSVTRLNHPGDWGTQFGKLIVGFKKWGDEKKLEADPIKHLLDVYVAFHKELEIHPELEEQARAAFAELELGKKEYVALWKQFRDLSLREFKKIYVLLDVSFDEEHGESFYTDKMSAVLALAKKKNVSEMSDGALIIPLEGMPPVLLLKSNGSSTYHTRDMASAVYRINKLKAEKLVYVVGQEQILHFKQVFSALSKLGYDSSTMCHVPFGLYQFSEGKMSTRKGNVIFLEDILSQAQELVLKTIKEKNPGLSDKETVARIVGLGAVVFGDLQNDRIKEILFDWDRLLDFQGDAGPYVQYTYARLKSVLRKAGVGKVDGGELIVEKKKKGAVDVSKLYQPSEERLVLDLESYPRVLKSALATHHPHLVAQYLLKLCRTANEFYHSCSIIGSDEEKERLLLVGKTALLIKSALGILGIGVVEEM